MEIASKNLDYQLQQVVRLYPTTRDSWEPLEDFKKLVH
jgi:hypothetical protein